ncbi:hypothetical protein F5B19DRAFT_446846 [Rostrohypoxylon terebratum]|nr:hypothetical protein F5B19DRAFT_446846 [Rostrohypoxylon terebratum]
MDSSSLAAIELGYEPRPSWYIRPRVPRWHPGHVKRRAQMNARRWERTLFTPSALTRLCESPCNDDKDSHLLLVANDWIRVLHELNDRELRNPDHRFDEYCAVYQFSKLYMMVYRLHDRIYQYSRGVPQVCQTAEHHRTTYVGVPESDVAQARQVMAKLLQMGFGTWIEDITLGGWTYAYPCAEFTEFAFNPITYVLTWSDHEDGLVNCHGMVLDMVFGAGKLTEEELEEKNELEPSEPRSTYLWILGVPEGECESPDSVPRKAGTQLPAQTPQITPNMSLDISIDLSENTDTVSSRTSSSSIHRVTY